MAWHFLLFSDVSNIGMVINIPVVPRAVARALIGRGVNSHIFVLYPTNFF